MNRSYFTLVLISTFLKLVCGHTERTLHEKRFPPRELKDLGIFHPYQEQIPRHCWNPPRNADIHKCCPIPRLYSDEILDSCGIEKIEEDEEPKRGLSKLACKDGMCLMRKSNLLTEDERVDYEKLRIYLDQWAADNPDFTEAILEAKKHCAYKESAEFSNCDPDHIYVCLTAHIIWHCKFKDTSECKELHEHIEECRPYYYRKEDESLEWHPNTDTKHRYE
ncbi:unnamed protein product [Spodoptera littoralis]|uniref:Uncharacterized protein n=1 Tax=Spodoptera littoralis TaxID=7109 RepID=A0A9P0N010_SPOLI|nr:unnamed protein product [Spodoptera littoralis]CAH1636593.1 unnamed protein product [Spodoptera littoralis]